MTTNMELASQVGERDGAASAGEAWVSRRPESCGIGEKLFTFFLTDFQNQNGRRIWTNQSYLFNKFQKCEKASGRLRKIFSFWYTENGESSYKTA